MNNLGLSQGMSVKDAERIIFTSTYLGSGAVNRIAKSSLVNHELAKSFIQDKFNIYRQNADPNLKWVATPRGVTFTPTYNAATPFEEEWYKEYRQPGTTDVAFKWNGVDGFVADALNGNKGDVQSYMPVTADGYIGFLDDGDYLLPIAIQTNSIDVQPLTPGGYNTPATFGIAFRNNAVYAMNSLVWVKATDMSCELDSDFFSLIDIVATPSSPLATGVTVVLAKKNPDVLQPDVYDKITGVAFGAWTFRHSDNTTATLAGAGNSVETNGSYAMTTTLKAGVWTIELAHPGHDIPLVTTFTVAP